MSPKSKVGPKSRPVRVISVTSGKGGVGKTNVVANLALVLARKGKKVLVWDADLGLANIDVLLGLNAKFNIHHLLKGEKSLEEIIIEGPGGIKIMPASSGIQELAHLGHGQKMQLLDELDHYDQELDFLLVDTGAGISSNVMYFNVAAQQCVVLVSPEPTSIMDAYAVIKVMATRYNEKRFLILPNLVSGAKEAKDVFSLLAAVADQHLSSIALDYLGFIPRDEYLPQAVMRRRAVVELYPSAQTSRSFGELGTRLLRLEPETPAEGNIKFFFQRLLQV